MASAKLPQLIAHRGNAAEFPENTLPALRSALDLGARHIEIDVQLAADRQPFLLNDSSLKRTAGVDRSALEMTWQELAEIRVGEPQRFQQRYADVRIPTLVQAVNLIASHPTATAFVELKRASLRAFGPEIVIRKVCEVLKPAMRQCVIVSFDLAAIHHVRQVTSYRIGWMLSDYSSLSALKSEALVPDYLLCDRQLLTQSTSQLWRGPWQWIIYDVTSRQQAAELAARGARFVATSAVREMIVALSAVPA